MNVIQMRDHLLVPSRHRQPLTSTSGRRLDSVAASVAPILLLVRRRGTTPRRGYGAGRERTDIRGPARPGPGRHRGRTGHGTTVRASPARPACARAAAAVCSTSARAPPSPPPWPAAHGNGGRTCPSAIPLLSPTSCSRNAARRRGAYRPSPGSPWRGSRPPGHRGASATRHSPSSAPTCQRWTNSRAQPAPTGTAGLRRSRRVPARTGHRSPRPPAPSHLTSTYVGGPVLCGPAVLDPAVLGPLRDGACDAVGERAGAPHPAHPAAGGVPHPAQLAGGPAPRAEPDASAAELSQSWRLGPVCLVAVTAAM